MNVSSNPSALRSQKEITDALLLLMQKYPYDQISVKQILLEARIARMTFYRNYDSKEDVLISLIKSILLYSICCFTIRGRAIEISLSGLISQNGFPEHVTISTMATGNEVIQDVRACRNQPHLDRVPISER